MATYKVIQDVEAEDKLLGPLTLRQFIYGGIAAVSAYLGFLLATKGAAFMLVVFAPITLVCGFFAFPWGQDQPTEVWALAKIRFLFKPRKRVWDQSGAKDMVTVTAPKVVEHQLTNGLNQAEVQSRLSALANTIDSRGWAIKNVNVNMSDSAIPAADASDRLVQAVSLPQEVSNIDVRASDDILDESANPVAHHFDNMISANAATYRHQLMTEMQQPSMSQQAAAPLSVPQAPVQPPAATPVQAVPTLPLVPTAQTPADQWFGAGQTPTVSGLQQPALLDDTTNGSSGMNYTVAAVPTAEEEALVDKLRAENASMSAAYGHLKTLKTPEQLEAEARAAVAAATAKPSVTPTQQAAIINLANNDDLNVATIARQAYEQVSRHSDGEVVVSLR